MRIRKYLVGYVSIGLLALAGAEELQAANAIQVGDVQIDPPTICCLGFSVPIVTGDDDYDAVSTIEYRRSGTVNWMPGLPLLRPTS